MTNLKKITVAMAVVVTVGAYLPQSANADGPLRRWWRNITGRNNTAAASGCGCKLLNRQTALAPRLLPPIHTTCNLASACVLANKLAAEP